MKVIIDKKEIDVDRIKVFDKDGNPYRIKQDIQHGIEIHADALMGTMYIEPHVSNVVTILTKE